MTSQDFNTDSDSLVVSTDKPSPDQLNRLFAECEWDAAKRTPARTQEYLDRLCECSCHYDGSRLVGFGKFSFDGYITCLADILVAPDYRGRGIGNAITAHLLQLSKDKHGAMGSWLLDQSGFEKFYSSHGFKALSQQPRMMYKTF